MQASQHSQSKPVKAKRRARRGQNLVELALTLPFVLVLILFIIEFGRLWYTYEAAKVVAMEGAHVAAMYHNLASGKQQMDSKMAVFTKQDIAFTVASVGQVLNKHAYEATVVVTYQPLCFGISFPTLNGQKVSIIPENFDITYNAVEDVGLY